MCHFIEQTNWGLVNPIVIRSVYLSAQFSLISTTHFNTMSPSSYYWFNKLDSWALHRIVFATNITAFPVFPVGTLLPAIATMIEVICNDRLGKKVRVKCNEDDTIGDLKKLIAAQVGTRPEKIRIQKWYTIYKDHVTLEDYEIHDGMGLELYYN